MIFKIIYYKIIYLKWINFFGYNVDTSKYEKKNTSPRDRGYFNE